MDARKEKTRREQAQRELHKTLRQAKMAGLAVNRTQQTDAVKAAARAKRAVIKMTLKGAGSGSLTPRFN